jgi:hypothetical protein
MHQSTPTPGPGARVACSSAAVATGLPLPHSAPFRRMIDCPAVLERLEWSARRPTTRGTRHRICACMHLTGRGALQDGRRALRGPGAARPTARTHINTQTLARRPAACVAGTELSSGAGGGCADRLCGRQPTRCCWAAPTRRALLWAHAWLPVRAPCRILPAGTRRMISVAVAGPGARWRSTSGAHPSPVAPSISADHPQ